MVPRSPASSLEQGYCAYLSRSGTSQLQTTRMAVYTKEPTGSGVALGREHSSPRRMLMILHIGSSHTSTVRTRTFPVEMYADSVAVGRGFTNVSLTEGLRAVSDHHGR